MKEIIYYEAYDGTRFEDAGECADYEHKIKLNQYKNDFKIFNSNREELDFNNENVTQDDVFYIIIKSPAAADTISDWFEYYGAENPFENCGGWRSAVGTWAYKDDYYGSEGWYKIESELDRLQELLAELKGE